MPSYRVQILTELTCEIEAANYVDADGGPPVTALLTSLKALTIEPV
jgi:hypothetical protein